MKLEIVINEDIKQAMRAKDAKKLEALRAIKAALLLAKTGKDLSSGEIPDEVELTLLQKLVKQRKESAELYSSQGRPELAEVEQYQAKIIEDYLPQQMTEEEIKAVVDGIIAETGASEMKDMGRVMGAASKSLAGKADNKLIATLVKTALTT